MSLQFVRNALSSYGAGLDAGGFIVRKDGKRIDVKANIKGKRLRFESFNGRLIASGGLQESFVQSFVEKYWFWEKEKVAS